MDAVNLFDHKGRFFEVLQETPRSQMEEPMRNLRLIRRYLFIPVVIVFLSGCAQIPFLSKREEGSSPPKGVAAKRPPTPAELEKGQEVLRAGLDSVATAMSQLETESAKTRLQVDELVKKLDQLAADFTQARTTTDVEIKKVREELGARLAEVRAGVQALLSRSDQLEADVSEIKAMEATLKGEIEKLKAKGTPKRQR